MYVLVNISGAPKAPVTPNGDATAFEQRSENLPARCEVAAKDDKNIKLASDSVPTLSLQRSHDVPTASLQRPWHSFSAQELAAAFLRRAHDVLTAHTASTQRAHSVLTALIAFKAFYLYFIFRTTQFCEYSDLFGLFEAYRHSI